MTSPESMERWGNKKDAFLCFSSGGRDLEIRGTMTPQKLLGDFPGKQMCDDASMILSEVCMTYL